jgi:hypothetical protein
MTFALLLQAGLLERLDEAGAAERTRHEARERFLRLGIVDGIAALERRATAR